MPQFFERAEPNALWQTDLLEDEPTAAGTVHGVFLLDDHSRYCGGGGDFFASKAEDNVLLVQVAAASRHGLPVEVLLDNGSQFQVVDPQAREQGARTRYRAGWESLGVTVTYAAPYHPQTMGKEECFNRFVKEGFLDEVRVRVKDLEELNAGFERWRGWYNHSRAHSALDFRSPSSRYRSGAQVSEALIWQGFAKQEERRVRLDGKIQVGKRLFQLPCGWERSQVKVYRLGDKIKVVGGKEQRALGEWQV